MQSEFLIAVSNILEKLTFVFKFTKNRKKSQHNHSFNGRPKKKLNSANMELGSIVNEIE